MATRAPTKQTTTGKLTTKVGNLTRDVELKCSAKGTWWCKFSIAVSPWVRDAHGGHQGEAEYYDCRAFGTLAECLAESVGKGDRVIVHGEGTVEDYTRKDGTAGQAKVILVRDAGVELRWATVSIHKATRSTSQEPIIGSDGEVIDF